MLFEQYTKALMLRRELEIQLMDMRCAPVDDARVVARDDLQLFIQQYNTRCARWADGMRAVQAALDVLYEKGETR